MDFIEQYRLLNEHVPKYKDVWDYVLSKNNLTLYEYSSEGYDMLAPISQVLFRLHQTYQKKHFTIINYVWSMNTTKNKIEAFPNIEDLVRNILGPDQAQFTNQLYIITAARSTQIFELAKTHPNFNKDLSLALQIEKNHKIAVIVLPNNITVIFTNKQNISDMQTYYSIVPIVYPKEDLPTELIDSFLALYNKDYQKIYTNLNILFEDIDVSQIKLEILERDLTALFRNTNKTEALENEINNLKRQLEDYYNEIARILSNIQYKEMQKLVILNTDSSEIIKTIISYLQNNKLVERFKVKDGRLNVTVRTPIYFADEEYLNKLFDTSRSYIHGYESDTHKLLKEAFIDKKVKLIVKATLAINIAALGTYNGGRFNQFRDMIHALSISAQETSFLDALPQPHLVHHNCFGANETHILKAAQNGDYIGVIAQGIAACQSINFGDQTVCTRFLNDITKNFPNTKFILDEETNEQITYSEWKQRKNNETN